MLDHVSIGVRSAADAKRFYEPVLAQLGYRCLSDSDGVLGFGKDKGEFWVLEVAEPVPANAESGLHFCFIADRREQVDAFHHTALANGGRDNGRPGLRPDYGDDYYASFVIDPSGYRLEAYCANA